MRRSEIISAALLVAFGLVMMAAVIPKYVAGGGQQSDLSPAFMPYVAVGIMTLVMAIFLVMKRIPRTMITSPAKTHRQEKYVVQKPPISGPTATAIAPAAATRP